MCVIFKYFTLMETKKRGCVYFFRHVGLSPVKIGYSESESPMNRFLSFKTYAPYGSEILGFIIISDAKDLESALHRKYASKRLDGEWFEITEEEVKREIDFYTEVSLVKERNEFQIAWARFIRDNEGKIYKEVRSFKTKPETKFEQFKKLFLSDTNINRSRIAEEMGVSRKTIQLWIKKIQNIE